MLTSKMTHIEIELPKWTGLSELKPNQLDKIPNDLFSMDVLKFVVYSDLMIWSNVSCRYRKAVDIYMDRYSKTYEYLIQVWENFNILKTEDPGMFYLPWTKNLPRTYIGPQTNGWKRQHFCSIAMRNPIKFLLIHLKCNNEAINTLKVILNDGLSGLKILGKSSPPPISEKRLHIWLDYGILDPMGNDTVMINLKKYLTEKGGDIIEEHNGKIGVNSDAIRSNISHIFDEIASRIMDDGFMPRLQKNNKLSFFN